MNNYYVLAQIAVMAIVTMLLRFLPFLVFGKTKETPPFIMYLGKVLPYAIMGMLVVYCLRGISFVAVSSWLPSFIAILSVVLLHVWKRQTLLSILGGTIIYMLLLHVL